MNRRNISSLRIKILEKYRYLCVYCGREATCVDHVLPWDWSHDDSEENLVASCTECNVTASDKVFNSFEEKRNYILNNKKRYKKVKKLDYVPICNVCHEEFEPRKDGAGLFICGACNE